jgi:hypothetical protein
MANDRMIKKLYECKPIPSVFAERPKIRWEKDMKEDLIILKTNIWTKCTQDRVKWKEVVEKARTFKQ